MKESDLVIGQAVYIYVDPRNVNDPSQSPVWECSVESIETTKRLGEDGEISEIFLRLVCGMDSMRRSLDSIFLDRADAMAHALEKVRKQRSIYIKKAKEQSALLGLLAEDEFLENWMK